MIPRRVILAAAAALASLAYAAVFPLSPPLPGERARVIDGDTVELGPNRVRFWGIDAPERIQQCADDAGRAYRAGAASTAHLAQMIAGRPLSCRPIEKDRYGRQVAICWANGDWLSVNARMVLEGMAFATTDYDRLAAIYLPLDAIASARGHGLRQLRCQRPADFRRSSR
ncbi:succinoglycan biosynthesis protein ExoI [Tepidicaulis marinus]|uniref:Succinoglycan biosynthesis protein ExoI n=1 Tax=Tepidicaulis marinus TaxID=1333998 RepID=A0A081BF30_9HYPH|nr:thermonuclease family protein [Tepidicaulis marinus]GAK46648.1 succinoglycan biosynthesis protein ExoI [Tepidicaulis marinus]